ncbi:MAG: hypothetical protein MZU84_07265 [Sphingobacterium sp.]|nr:hypothetical protein [Sphingobacterium sp.]
MTMRELSYMRRRRTRHHQDVQGSALLASSSRRSATTSSIRTGRQDRRGALSGGQGQPA